MRTFALALVLTAGPAAAADPPAKLDRYGDPLPPGAVMRLGTLRARAPISSFGIEKDGTVVTVGEDLAVRAWPADGDRPAAVVRLGKPDRSFNRPHVSPDGRLVAVPEADKVRVWDWRPDPPKEVAALPVAGRRELLFAPDGAKLAVVVGHRQLVLCDVATGKAEAIDGGAATVEAVGFSGAGGRDGAVRLWDAATGRPRVSVPAAFMNEPNIEFGPGGTHVYCPSADHQTVVKWDAATGAEVRRFAYQDGTPKRGSLCAYGVTADGKSVFAASPAYDLDLLPVVAVWDAETGAVRSQTATKERHLFMIPQGRFSADGKHFASSSDLHPLDDLTKSALPPKTRALRGAFSADGRYYAYLGAAGDKRPAEYLVHVTDLKDGTTTPLVPHEPWGTAVGLSADGAALAVASEKGVAFHDARTGKEFGRYAAELPYVRAAVFTPDGKRLLTAHDDTAPLVWPVPARPAK